MVTKRPNIEAVANWQAANDGNEVDDSSPTQTHLFNFILEYLPHCLSIDLMLCIELSPSYQDTVIDSGVDYCNYLIPGFLFNCTYDVERPSCDAVVSQNSTDLMFLKARNDALEHFTASRLLERFCNDRSIRALVKQSISAFSIAAGRRVCGQCRNGYCR